MLVLIFFDALPKLKKDTEMIFILFHVFMHVRHA